MISANEIQNWNDQAVTLMECGEVERAFRLLHHARERLSGCILQPTPLPEQNKQAVAPLTRTTTEPPTLSTRVLCEALDDCEDADHQDSSTTSTTIKMRAVPESGISSPVTSFPSTQSAYEENEGDIEEEEEPRNHTYSMMDDDDCSVDRDIMMHLPDFYPYPFAFRLVATTKQPSSIGDDNEILVLNTEQYNSCAATCLFNQAVCCHLAWDDTKCPKDKRYLLQQARTFYEEAFELITRNTDLSFRRSGEGVAALLKILLAITVNALHCNAELCDAPQVARWNRIRQFALNLATQFSQQYAQHQLWYSHEFRLMQGFLNQVHLSRAPAA